MPQMMSTGYLKVGNDYINPHNIAHIAKGKDGKTFVGYNTFVQSPFGVIPMSDRIDVDTDKFAKCAVKAMQTGEIIDVMA
ncbi:hypothetical protein IKE67_00625 [bacterium]|nr:hypothetical protein [bacterium]